MDPVENVSKDSLDSNNVYVLDSEHECFVWVGAGQSKFISLGFTRFHFISLGFTMLLLFRFDASLPIYLIFHSFSDSQSSHLCLLSGTHPKNNCYTKICKLSVFLFELNEGATQYSLHSPLSLLQRHQ